jgi:hypothetical protein
VEVAWLSVILRIAVIDFSHGPTINDAHSFVMVHVLSRFHPAVIS